MTLELFGLITCIDKFLTQRYSCVVIPEFEVDGFLPAGIHAAESWQEIVERLAFSPRRHYLLAGLRAALLSLQAAGCLRVFIDGGFVSTKTDPGDFDACWEIHGVDATKLDPVLLIFDAGRLAQKVKFRGEFFPATWPADSTGRAFIDFFQTNKDNGNAKGIVSLDLQGATL